MDAVAADPRGTSSLDTPAAGVGRASWSTPPACIRDTLDRMLGHDAFTVTPRRGELLVFDKLARPLLGHILLAVPSERPRACCSRPTVYGNLLLGPTAEDIGDKPDRSTTAAGIAHLLRARRPMPALEQLGGHGAVYAGLRAATEHSDYQLAIHRRRATRASLGSAPPACRRRWRSPSTCASSSGTRAWRSSRASTPSGGPDAEHRGALPAALRAAAVDRRRPRLRPRRVLLRAGHAGRADAALPAPIPPLDLEGLRRRTRATMGRCQGFYCAAELDSLLAEGPAR